MAKRHSRWTVARRCPLGADYPMKKQRTEITQNSDGRARVRRTIAGFTDRDRRVVAALAELLTAQSVGVSVKGLPQRASNHSGCRSWTKWHASQTHGRMDGFASRARRLRFRRPAGFLPQATAGKTRAKDLSLAPYEREGDVAPLGVHQQKSYP